MQYGIFTTVPPTKNCTSNIIFIVNKAPKPRLRVGAVVCSILFSKIQWIAPDYIPSTLVTYPIEIIFITFTTRINKD